MVNALFIDYTTLLDANGHLAQPSICALKMVADKIDNIRIVCLNTKQEMHDFNYDEHLNELLHTLWPSMEKPLFFSCVEMDSWKDVVSAVSVWMLNQNVLSFALFCNDNRYEYSIGKAWPNNNIFNGHFSEAQAKDVLWVLSNFKTSISKDTTVFFCSDTHFGHANIIKYCNRPWNHGKDSNGEVIATEEDVLAMDNAMIERWNSVVGKDDIVWHLGDFALGGKAVAERVFPQLNGKINLVMGNHDHWKVSWYYDLGFHRVYDRPVIINGFVILSHAPLQFLNSNCPFYNISGHIHDSPAYQTWSKVGCCVCVERHDYTPVSWKTIKQKYEELNGKVE